MLKIRLSKRAHKTLAKLPAKHGKQIAQLLQTMALNPSAVQSIELRQYVPWRRVRCGEYRIIFQIDGDELFVALIGKRNDDEIYRMVSRMMSAR